MVKRASISLLMAVALAAAPVGAQTSEAAAGKPVTLSQKDVAELVLKQGLKTQEVAAKYAQSRSLALLTQTAYDWRLSLESGLENDRNETLAQTGDFKYERYRTTTSLAKSLLTGTTLTFDYSRISQKADTTTSTSLTQDSFGVALEQSLWGNMLGAGDRATVNKAEAEYQATISLRANELEDVVLEALRQFWNTYVAQENFREALASRERTEKLVAAVRRKNSLGYASPGEFAQVQAELETRIQTVKTSSTDYLRNLDQLLTLLNLPRGTEINFVVSKEIPPVPKLSERAAEELRAVKSQQLKLKAAEHGLTVAKSKSRPNLNFVGSYRVNGVEDTSQGAFTEMNSGSRPKTYAGLKFTYTFGSGALDEDVRAKQAALTLEEVRLDRTRSEEQDRLVQAERKVASSFAVAQSTQKQKGFREKAVQELTRSYNQGRTDIKILIDAMNGLFATEVQNVRALGDYQIALNEWAAARDELIPDEEKKESSR